VHDLKIDRNQCSKLDRFFGGREFVSFVVELGIGIAHYIEKIPLHVTPLLNGPIPDVRGITYENALLVGDLRNDLS
jgi:hypothetical protein